MNEADYPFDTLDHACMSYRKLLADFHNKAVSKDEFETVLSKMQGRWGSLSKRRTLNAETGKYARPR